MSGSCWFYRLRFCAFNDNWDNKSQSKAFVAISMPATHKYSKQVITLSENFALYELIVFVTN